MLAGLFILGLMAAATMPDVVDLLRPDPGGGEDDASGEDGDPADGPPGNADGSGADPAPDQTEGEDLFIDPLPGRVTVDSFNAGVDTLTIAVPDEAEEFALHEATDDAPARLTYDIQGGGVEIAFDGLDTVPVADIFLRVSDASSPTLDVDIALSNLLHETEPGVVAPPIGPVDPELPDVVPPPGDPGEILVPVDPTLPDEPAPPIPGGGGDVLLPVQEDDPLTGLQTDAPLIEPLREDAGQAVVGGQGGDGTTGADVFWLYADAGLPAVARITGFTPGEDLLRISLNPQIAAEGIVDIVPSEDGADGLVRVDGVTVALLPGAPDATLADLHVETRPDVFP